MPPSNVLRLRAAQSGSSFSSRASGSAASNSSAPAKRTTHLERCSHCLNIIPVTSTLERHIAATPACRAAEQARVQDERHKRAAQWQAGQTSTLGVGERVRQPEGSAPVRPAPEPAEQARAHKRHKVSAETSSGESASMIVEPSAPVARAPSPSAPIATNTQQTHRRYKVTLETIPDVQAPTILEPRTRIALSPPAAGTEAPTPQAPRAGANLAPVPPGRKRKRKKGKGKRSGRRARRGLRRWKGLYVEDFPDPLAGAPISDEQAPELDLDAHMRACGNLGVPKHFETADMLLTTGMTDAAKERHLRSTLYRGQTPWTNVDHLYLDVDKLLHRPHFSLYDIDIFDGRDKRPQYMVSRDIIQALRDIFANQDFEKGFKAAPERHYLSPQKVQRVYSDAYTANWWWREQEKMRGKGAATIAPVIIATDQTSLAVMCGGQKAYPVHVTVGNIDKATRRKGSEGAMVLLGFLPVDGFEDIENDAERRRLKADLVHRAMEKMLEPLRKASEEGVEMWCPDGRLRRVYPRIAAYMADWPEQNLHSCTSEGSCPVCSAKWGERGDYPQQAPLRDRDETLDAIRAYFVHQDVGELRDLNLKPVWPWWGDLTHVNLATCFTPDLLHQLYQGVFKSHLVRWLKHLVGADVLDERFQAMPMAQGMRHFAKGITSIQQWTARESKQMLSQILPIVLGDLTPELSRLVRSVVDFIFRAHASSMTDNDIDDLERDLSTFHELKGLLVAKGFYESEGRFNRIPKLHMLSHYAHFIRELGTLDGYNTETPERLHIEYAKVPWRASNKVRPMPQMLKYIQRQQAIKIQRTYMNRYLGIESKDEDKADVEGEDENEETVEIDGYEGRCGGEETASNDEASEDDVDSDDSDAEGDQSDLGEQPVSYPSPRRHMAASPTRPNMLIKDIVKTLGAKDLMAAIKTFMTKRLGVPEYDVMLSEKNRVHVWHRLYLHHQPPPFAPFEPPRRDVVRAGALVLGTGGRIRKEPVWDTALYVERPNQFRTRLDDAGEEKHGILRYRAGRVRAIFKLPGHLQRYYSGQLAYLEVFTPFDASVLPFSKMHSTQPDFDSRNRRRVLVVPITDIVMACHLSPKFNRLDPELQLTSRTDLFTIGRYFWLNNYYNHTFFDYMQHWWRTRPTTRQRLLRLVRR
ncbi:hypothetical protein FS749_002924 [Ceratobasidium sp. UAMH 11750]|nr:hypothetical protein FS749_002924 [Ceratobasidium sp. UAMH 11750]